MTEKDRMVQELPEEARKKILNGKLLSLLGFAMRAGKLSCGTDRVCDDIRRHGIPTTGRKNEAPARDSAYRRRCLGEHEEENNQCLHIL